MTTTTRMRARLPLAAVAAVAGLLAGCGAVTRLDAHDDRAFASVRASWHGAAGDGVDLQAGRVQARSSQQLGDQSSVFGGPNRVDGPVMLQHRVKQEHAHVAYSSRIEFSPRFDVHWMAGAATARSDWQTRSARTTDPALDSRTSWHGPMGGGRVRFGLAAQWSLEGRVTGAVALGGRADRGHFVLGEAVVAWRPLPQGLVLRGGLASFSSSTRALPGDTERTLRVSGPYVNIGLDF